jgi:GDPmannose 4,6-dehydratase
MMQYQQPEEFIVSTGVLHSVREFVEIALQAAGLESNVEKYVEYDPSLERSSPDRCLVGDSSKAREILNWTPKINFENLVQLMVENDLQIESQS